MKISKYDNGLFLTFNNEGDYIGFSEVDGEAYVEFEGDSSYETMCRDADLSVKELELIRDWFIEFVDYMKEKRDER